MLAIRGSIDAGFTLRRLWILILFLQVPSLRVIYEYAPVPDLLAPLLIAGAALVYVVLLNPCLWPVLVKRLMDSRWPSLALLLAFTVANIVIFPLADALELQGRGSVADEAMILPYMAWQGGGALYDDSAIPKGIPMSPGPGWILINAPFLTGDGLLYPLFGPFWMLALLFGLRWMGHAWRDLNRFMLALASSLIVWELSVTGHDMIAMSMVIALLGTASLIAFDHPRLWPVLLSAAALGVFATARIIYPFIAPLIALLHFRAHPRRAVTVFLLATAIAALIHAWHYAQNTVYDPLHLMGRAEDRMGPGLILAGAAATLLMGGLALRYVTRSAAQRLIWFLACFATPLLFISFGELGERAFDFADWEGANYLLPVMPTALIVCFMFGTGREAGTRRAGPLSAPG